MIRIITAVHQSCLFQLSSCLLLKLKPSDWIEYSRLSPNSWCLYDHVIPARERNASAAVDVNSYSGRLVGCTALYPTTLGSAWDTFCRQKLTCKTRRLQHLRMALGLSTRNCATKRTARKIDKTLGKKTKKKNIRQPVRFLCLTNFLFLYLGCCLGYYFCFCLRPSASLFVPFPLLCPPSPL